MTSDGAIPRTRVALAERFHELGVAERTYSLYGSHRESAMVMDHRSHGWVVFYCERGSETDPRVHLTEAAACGDLFEEVVRDEHAFFTLVAGPAPAEEADAAFDAWLAERRANRGSLLAGDWKDDDAPWTASGAWFRRYFVRITAIRLLEERI